HPADQVLSDEELAFLSEVNRPKHRRIRWGWWLYWTLVLGSALLVLGFSFHRYSLAVDYGYSRLGDLLFTQPPPAEVQDASQGLPPGSILAFYDEQWVACTPVEAGWQCQGLDIRQ